MDMKLAVPGFELLRRIGEGATSEVFLARRLRSSPQESLVAVKLLKNVHRGNAGIQARFQAEWQLAQRLSQKLPPDAAVIVPLESINTPGCVAHILKYIDGEALSIYQARLPFVLPEVSIALCLRILAALEFAHANGVIHRDLKPSNILIEKSGGVFLTDFGIAQQSDMTSHTATGTLMGSPDFMSPEQVRGDVLGPSSDLFSLSAILYFLVTGMRPFGRNTTIAILTAIQNGQVEAPHLKNPKISAALSRIILKGLHPASQHRYQSTQQMIQALQEYLDGIGLPSENFQFEKWANDPSEQTFSALQRIAEHLVLRGQKQAQAGQCDEALETVAHLGLVAPESMHVARIMELVLATPPQILEQPAFDSKNLRPHSFWEKNPMAGSAAIKRKFLKNAFFIGAFLLTGAAGFMFGIALKRSPFMTQHEPVLSSDLKADASKEHATSPKKEGSISTLKSNPKPVLYEESTQDPTELASVIPEEPKVPTHGVVEFLVGRGTQVFFDGERIDPSQPHLATVGEHKIRLVKKGFDPILQTVTVKSTEPTKVIVK